MIRTILLPIQGQLQKYMSIYQVGNFIQVKMIKIHMQDSKLFMIYKDKIPRKFITL
jgi:hypothetical protein